MHGNNKQAGPHVTRKLITRKTLSSCYFCCRCYQPGDVNGLTKFDLIIYNIKIAMFSEGRI